VLLVHDCIIHLICPKMMRMLQLFESSKQRHAPGPTYIYNMGYGDQNYAQTIPNFLNS
jgi:hypothetical protein